MKRFVKQRTWSRIGSGTFYTVCYEWVDQNALLSCMGADIPGYPQNVMDYETCLAQSMRQLCITYYASTNGQSDGFIKAPSQTGYNSTWANNAVRVEALGVNHLQMKKHPRMAEIYNDAFNGVHGQSFFTPRRQ